MPTSCCVVGCTIRRQPKGSHSGTGISLFRIPANRRQRRAWVAAIARQNWFPKSWERVCNKHFVAGWPSDDPKDVDYRPTLLMKGNNPDVTSHKETNRKQRASKMSEISHLKEVAEVLCIAVLCLQFPCLKAPQICRYHHHHRHHQFYFRHLAHIHIKIHKSILC